MAEKKQQRQQLCSFCKRPDESGSLAAYEERGKIYWICYKCYIVRKSK